jgi:putative acetyltransferase
MIELIHPNSSSLWETARVLVREYAASLNVNLDFQNFDEELLQFEKEYAPPGGTFLLARKFSDLRSHGDIRNHGDLRSDDLRNGELYSRGEGKDAEYLGCGALRRFSASDCEMKRLYVRSTGRNLGIGRQIALALIGEAKELGYERVLLDTLPTMQSAQSLYASLGFEPTPPYRFNPIPGSTFLKLDL